MCYLHIYALVCCNNFVILLPENFQLGCSYTTTPVYCYTEVIDGEWSHLVTMACNEEDTNMDAWKYWNGQYIDELNS